MRLQKYLAMCGVASRRHAEKLISDGHVSVNGETVTVLGTCIDELNDVVQVDGECIVPEAEKHYIAYNKPVGEVTTSSDPEGRATVMDRFSDYPVRLFPVGRLDYDSEGLLLLTNDGELMNRLLHPRYEIKKTYLARISSQISNEALVRLRRGVLIDGKMTSPAEVRVVRFNAFSTDLIVTIHEGRNRQVRKMVDSVGHKVFSLKRIGFGPVRLNDLPTGMWRHLSEEELSLLKRET